MRGLVTTRPDGSTKKLKCKGLWWGHKGAGAEEDEEEPESPSPSSIMRKVSGLSLGSIDSSSLLNMRRAPWLDRADCQYYSPGYPEENCFLLIDSLQQHNVVPGIENLHVVFVVNYIQEVPMWRLIYSRPERSTDGRAVLDYHCFVVQSVAHSKSKNTSSPQLKKSYTATSSLFDSPLSPALSPASSKQPSLFARQATSSLENFLTGSDARKESDDEVKPCDVAYVWDLDCTLAFPTRLYSYADWALRVTAMDSFPTRLQRMYRVVPASKYKANFRSNRQHHPRKVDGTWIQHPPPKHPRIVGPNTDDMTQSNVHRYVVPDAAALVGDETDVTAFGEMMNEDEFLKRFNVFL